MDQAVIRDYAIIRESARRIAEAANGTMQALTEARVEQEPAFTDRMLGRIEHAMEGFETKGVRWTAKTLTDRGPKAQEKQFGADFVGVLTIRIPEYSVSKGFLAQAKLIEPNASIGEREFERMRRQCEEMLTVSPDSYVFIYSVSRISVVPALSVISAGRCNPHDLYSRSVSRFYEEHFQSFIGDRDIHAPSITALEQARERTRARRLLYLGAQTE
jgi:hypothetical protein